MFNKKNLVLGSILVFVFAFLMVQSVFASPSFLVRTTNITFTGGNNTNYSGSNTYAFSSTWRNSTLNETIVSYNFTLYYPSGVPATYTSSTTPAVTIGNAAGVLNDTAMDMNITFTQDQLGGAGTYNFTFGMVTNNGTNTTTNITTNTYFRIAGGLMTGSLSGSNVSYPNAVSVTPTETNIGDADIQYMLWRNTTLIGNTTGSAPAVNATVLSVGGVYVFVFNSTGGANWMVNSSISTRVINVSKGNLSFALTVSNVSYPNSLHAVVSESNIGDADVNYTLWRNSSTAPVNHSTTFGTAPAGETIELAADSSIYYVYTVNVTATSANWSANATGLSSTVYVTKGTPSLAITITPSTEVTYATSTTATASGCPSQGKDDVTCTFSRTGTIGSPETITLAPGTYTYEYASTAGANWSVSSVTSTLTVNPRSGSGESTTGGGTTTAGNTYTPTEDQLSGGYVRSVSAADAVSFAISSEAHSVHVDAITSTSVDVTVSSDPQTATIAVGETKKFDVTGDNYYDVSVKLNSIIGSSAELVVTKLHELMPTETTTTTTKTTTGETTTTGGETSTTTIPPSNGLLITVLLVVVAGALIWWFLLRGKAKYRYKKSLW